MHRLLAVLIVAIVTTACSSLGAGSGAPAPSASPRAAATSSEVAEFHPGAGSLSGRVIRIVPDGLVVNSADREVTVDLKLVVDVWKERSVPASAIEVGDDVFINGTEGSPFVARYVWSNIGRIDGVVAAIDNAGMDVQVRNLAGGTRMERVEFSADVQFGAVDGSVKLSRADLVVGRTIGAVVYRPPLGPLRATRIW